MATAFRFVFTGLRYLPSRTPDGIQLSEVTLFGPDGGQLPILAATNPGGQNINPSQPAGAAVDGLLQTKWFDAAMVTRGQSTLQLLLSALGHAVTDPGAKWAHTEAHDSITRCCAELWPRVLLPFGACAHDPTHGNLLSPRV